MFSGTVNVLKMFLQSLGQPIQERYTEFEERPKAYDELGRQLQQYMKIVEAYKTKVSLCWINVALDTDLHLPGAQWLHVSLNYRKSSMTIWMRLRFRRWTGWWTMSWSGWTVKWTSRANRVSLWSLWWKRQIYRPKHRSVTVRWTFFLEYMSMSSFSTMVHIKVLW